MIIPSLFHREPKYYLKDKYKKFELLGVDCNAEVTVEFPQCSIYKFDTVLEGTDFTCITKEITLPKECRSFQMKIHIDVEDYNKNKSNLRDYILDRVKKSKELTDTITRIRNEVGENREYSVHIETDTAQELDKEYGCYEEERITPVY